MNHDATERSAASPPPSAATASAITSVRTPVFLDVRGAERKIRPDDDRLSLAEREPLARNFADENHILEERRLYDVAKLLLPRQCLDQNPLRTRHSPTLSEVEEHGAAI